MTRPRPSCCAARSAAPTPSACAGCAGPSACWPRRPGDPGRGGDLLAPALLDPRDLAALPDSVAGPARHVARLLAVAKAAIRAGGSAEDVLWAIWDASGLAPRWQQAAAAGGAAGAAADRDLDAVLALFDQAAHFADTMPPGAPALFADSLAGQEIVGDTLAERAVRDDCVRLLTAHRSKGLEWDVVVVAGVQEETWPDLRLRGSVLGAGEVAEALYRGPCRGGPAGPGARWRPGR